MPRERKDADAALEALFEAAESPEKPNAVEAQRLHSLSRRARARRGRDIKYCIIAVLPEELAALHAVLENWEDEHNNISAVMYFTAAVPDREDPQKKQKIVIANVPSMGNSSSAVAATSVLKDFPNILDILIVGVAGGIPALPGEEDDVRLGDVVVSARKGLIQYDMVKLEEGVEPNIRSVMPPPSAHLLGCLNRLEMAKINGQFPWEAHAAHAANANSHWSRPKGDTDPSHKNPVASVLGQRRREGQPVIHLGIIGSANTLLKSSTIRDNLRRKLQIIAVEMEGSGIADAAWVFRSGYLVIRGVSDYCDKNKDTVAHWRPYACIAAAAYARALLESIPAA